MVALPKSYISNISKGAEVKVKSIDTNQIFTGKVSRINAKVNSQTQSIEVYIRIKDKNLKKECIWKHKLKQWNLVMFLHWTEAL